MSQLTTLFTNIADAIRAKTGSEELIQASNFPTEIANIPTGSEFIETTSEFLNGYAVTYPKDPAKGLGTVSLSYTFPNITVNVGSNLVIEYLPFEYSKTDTTGGTELTIDGKTIYEVEVTNTYKYVYNHIRNVPIVDGGTTVNIPQRGSYTYTSSTQLNEETLTNLLRNYKVELCMEDGPMFTTSTFPAFYFGLTDAEKETVFETYGTSTNAFTNSLLNESAGLGGGSNPILSISGNNLNSADSMVYFFDTYTGYNRATNTSGLSSSHVYRDTEEYGTSQKYYFVFYSVGVKTDGGNMYICRKGTATITTEITGVSANTDGNDTLYVKLDNATYKYGVMDSNNTQYFNCISKPEGYTFSIPSSLTGKYQGTGFNPFILTDADIRSCLTKTNTDPEDFEGRFIFCIRNGPGMQVVFGIDLYPIDAVTVTFKDVRGRLLSNEGYLYQGGDYVFTIKKGTSLSDYGFTSLERDSGSQPLFPSEISTDGTAVDATALAQVHNTDVVYQMVIS